MKRPHFDASVQGTGGQMSAIWREGNHRCPTLLDASPNTAGGGIPDDDEAFFAGCGRAKGLVDRAQQCFLLELFDLGFGELLFRLTFVEQRSRPVVRSRDGIATLFNPGHLFPVGYFRSERLYPTSKLIVVLLREF